MPAAIGGGAAAGFTIPTGLTLAGAGMVQIPTYMLALKAALLKKAALLGAGGVGYHVYSTNRARLGLGAGIRGNANVGFGARAGAGAGYNARYGDN